MKKLLGMIAAVLCATAANAADYTSGTITNLTSTSAGLLIMTSGALPDNCKNTPYGWMLIKQDSRALTAVTLLAKTKHPNAAVVVYTSPAESPGSFCVVQQLHPSAL